MKKMSEILALSITTPFLLILTGQSEGEKLRRKQNWNSPFHEIDGRSLFTFNIFHNF